MTVSKMRVCVVGGAGFVGSNLVESLLAAGHDVSVIDNFFTGKMSNLEDLAIQRIYNEDARQLTALAEIISKEHPHFVINLAMKCLPTSFSDPEGAFMSGVQIALNLAYLLRKNKYGFLLHFSSGEVYGTAQQPLMSEDHPTNPTTEYAAGKLAADHLLHSYHVMRDLNIAILRPFNLIGPKQNWQLYAAVVPTSIRRILMGEPPVIYGDGLQTRDFTYIKDVATFTSDILEDKIWNIRGSIVNIGSGIQTTIKSVMDAICDKLKYPTDKIHYSSPRIGDHRAHIADISKAKTTLGYSPKTDFKTAIDLTVDWFKTRLSR